MSSHAALGREEWGLSCSKRTQLPLHKGAPGGNTARGPRSRDPHRRRPRRGGGAGDGCPQPLLRLERQRRMCLL